MRRDHGPCGVLWRSAASLRGPGERCATIARQGRIGLMVEEGVSREPHSISDINIVAG